MQVEFRRGRRRCSCTSDCKAAGFSVKHMNSSFCSAAKVICQFITLACHFHSCCVSLLFLHLGNVPRLLHLTMQTEKNQSNTIRKEYHRP